MRIIDADALKTIKSIQSADFNSIETIRKWIDNAPTIDAVEVKRGEWIHKPQIGWGETWICSICGEKTTSSFMGKPRYEYCPMCGAKMDGERKTDD